jgi:hypothetical protein
MVHSMKLTIDLPFSEAEFAHAQEAARQGNAGLLRLLCQKEVSRFEAKMRTHPDYSDGLVRIERLAVEGYLYQKWRGHVDEAEEVYNIPKGWPNGTT